MAHLIETERKHPDCTLTIAGLCRLAQITRAQFYRHCGRAAEGESDAHCDEQVKVVALERPSYGYRRIRGCLRSSRCTC